MDEQNLDIDCSAKTTGFDYIKTKPQTNAYAVIIGFEKYRNLPSSKGSKNDSMLVNCLMVESLGVPKENISLIRDENYATKSDILVQIDSLKTKLKSTD